MIASPLTAPTKIIQSNFFLHQSLEKHPLWFVGKKSRNLRYDIIYTVSKILDGSLINQPARQLVYVMSLLTCLCVRTHAHDQSAQLILSLDMLLINTNTNLTCGPPQNTHTHIELRCVRHPERNVLSRWFW